MRHGFSTATLIAALIGTPALAAPVTGPAAKPPVAVVIPVPGAPPAKAAARMPKHQPDFAMMMQMVDRLFPPQPDPDATRLSLARTSAMAIWSDGSFSRMITGIYGGMFDRLMQMKKSDLIAAMGPRAKAAPAADVSLHDQAVAKDPYFDRRTAAVRAVIVEEAAKISEVIDPKVREGLARAMARRLDAKQLADTNAFFATPSGRAFAGQYMQLWADPDMMRSMMSSLPEMIRLMPDAMARIKAADARFPKPAPKPAKP